MECNKLQSEGSFGMEFVSLLTAGRSVELMEMPSKSNPSLLYGGGNKGKQPFPEEKRQKHSGDSTILKPFYYMGTRNRIVAL